MRQTIEIEIDKNGHIHPLDPLSVIFPGRAYLMLFPTAENELRKPVVGDVSAGNALVLLASPRFAQQPDVLSGEVQHLEMLPWQGQAFRFKFSRNNFNASMKSRIQEEYLLLIP